MAVVGVHGRTAWQEWVSFVPCPIDLEGPSGCGDLEIDIRVYDRDPASLDQLIRWGLISGADWGHPLGRWVSRRRSLATTAGHHASFPAKRRTTLPPVPAPASTAWSTCRRSFPNGRGRCPWSYCVPGVGVPCSLTWSPVHPNVLLDFSPCPPIRLGAWLSSRGSFSSVMGVSLDCPIVRYSVLDTLLANWRRAMHFTRQNPCPNCDRPNGTMTKCDTCGDVRCTRGGCVGASRGGRCKRCKKGKITYV